MFQKNIFDRVRPQVGTEDHFPSLKTTFAIQKSREIADDCWIGRAASRSLDGMGANSLRGDCPAHIAYLAGVFAPTKEKL